jgi:GAF domain-containing protein
MFEAEEKELLRTAGQQSSQAIELVELELAVADDHRRRDEMKADGGQVRAALGLMRHSGGASKG